MTDHVPGCRWEITSIDECEYRDTHYYCPHPEHACTCPPRPRLDGKYTGEIRKDGVLIPADEWIVLRAKDLAVPATLLAYHDECRRQGSPVSHLESILALYERITDWQTSHPELCKVPD